MAAPVDKPLISVEGITRHFGALTALSALSFQVQPGERRVIIGPNGAGKTTLFNLITGVVAPTSGRIRFQGEDITGWSPDAVARRGISRSFQRPSLFARLSVLENLCLAAQARRRGNYNLCGARRHLAGSEAKAHDAAAGVGLADRLSSAAGALSHGEQRQLEVGIALATDPRLLLLDEPTAGLSPEETQRMTRMLERLPRDVTQLIIEHDMDVVSTLADWVTVLHLGKVLVEGTFAEVKADSRVYGVYLGISP